MRKLDNFIIYSPSDLVCFMESPFASWMERLHLESPGTIEPDAVSEDMELIAKTGDQHEARFLGKLQAEGRDMILVEKKDSTEAQRITREAIASGREVIYQGALAMDRFAGFTDFIVRGEDGRYDIWDTKLARSAKPYHLVQLCCYAEMLAPLNQGIPEIIRVVLGNDKVVSHRTSDCFHYYLRLKHAFLEMMDSFSPDANPPPPSPNAEQRRWASHAEAWLKERDHLVQIAGINVSQIRKLEAAGIDTVEKLAACGLSRLPKMADETFHKVREQARMQVKARELPDGSPPPFEILKPSPETPHTGLALLPPESPGDIFFDIEGYPLENDGLEYLLGATTRVGGQMRFDDWWAHDERQEKQSFEAFIDWVMARWQQFPDLHVYHYAPYEITAMKRLMGKYGTREAEVDSLLRNGVFVDLYRIVRQGMRIGASSYSLKKVEKLYLEPRAGDVQDATASIVFYAQWQESGEAPDWRNSPILKKIRDYNQVDCDSTLLLTEWLRGKQVEHGIPYHPPHEEDRTGGAPKKDAPAPALENMELIRNMLAKLPEEGDERVIGELLAHFVEFHRRDNKPMWWARFERAAMSEEELHDDINCLGGLELEGAPVRDKRSLIATYRFDPDQDSKIATKSKVMPSHELNAKLEVVGLDSNDGRIDLRMSEAALTSKLGGAFPSRLSLIPDEFVSPGVIEQALKELAETWLDSGDIPPCLRRLLLRQPPRVDGVDPGAPLSDVHQAVPAMRESTLAIQGPPGTGKTYTASRLIKQLIESGKRVGITSNSRKAIINLFEGIHSAGADLDGSVYAVSNLSDKSLDHIPGIEATDSGSALGSYKKGIIAGTAWLFCRPEFAAQLDYLFIDEAGQVSLANVAAMSQATRNLVLLGDQNQLPMPTQGTHPGESGLSSLVYLLKGHAVVPPELGVFLGTTYRMHPDVCSFISDCYYEGKLQSAPQAANHKLALPDDPEPVPLETGILFHPVPHTGNTQDSPEEVAAIQGILKSLLGRTFTDSEGRSRPLGLEDILFVSPYNLQVRRMEKSLPAGAKIGSVDRFQGQEAPVVIVSLCSSAGEFGNRGLSFILDRNRLNVALSRAQALAIVVGDPNIANTDAGSVKELGLLNVFCAFANNR